MVLKIAKQSKCVKAALLASSIITASLFSSYLFTTPVMAESSIIKISSAGKTKSVKLTKSVPKTIRSDKSYAEIVVGDPAVASVSPLTDRTFYIVGNASGVTGISLFDEESNLVGAIDVEVGASSQKINQALRTALPKSKIKATTTDGRVILKGTAKNAVDASKARAIAEKYDPELIDSVEVTGSQQVNLEVRFLEAVRSKGKRLKMNISGSRQAGSTTSVLGGSLLADLVVGALPFGQFVTNIIKDGTNIDLVIDALEEKGLARNLAEPNLVALSGDTASFLAGGEYPIPVSSGDGAVSVAFKSFGVGLKFTPTVLANGLINLKLNPEVSTIDMANGAPLIAGGPVIPAVSVRRAETTLELRDGQSFVLAGLLQSSSSYNKSQLPWIGDVPILGALFRSSAYQKKETDLVIIVTPRLVKPLGPGDNPATPLDKTAPASESEFFVNGDMEVNRSHLRKISAAADGVLKSGHVIELE